MSESSQPSPPSQAPAGEASGERQPDAMPVLAGTLHVVDTTRGGGSALPQRRPVIPTVQAAAVAAGSFMAGAALAGLVHRRRRRAAALHTGPRTLRVGRRTARGNARRTGRTAELVQIISSRSLLVDVHLLGGTGDH